MVNWLSLLLNSTSSQVRSMPHLFFCPFVKNTLRTEDTSQNPNLNPHPSPHLPCPKPLDFFSNLQQSFPEHHHHRHFSGQNPSPCLARWWWRCGCWWRSSRERKNT
ncbi:hypothetical protein HanRHA438_Chr05g0208461 [Helianthus annuus]|uniref:Uncharacterized protein n=1 Tax=Helianthus annuus TaxID=4232 RepID=A0A251VIG1_HELAN|nr:hypothetical protein HanXRQr2_Chr05g0198841 [Helianthus annuus]KAJ0569190.1 hypothetical protein HanHA300_Chr05g0163251 [Helianthus annuus]KAJ0583486.1 hypothetical protein HanHA89_Chr05g0177141 [Helianthus annuus]KAJ0746220.1 hypothetical protein HanOQP8_Chr05g0175051 [Helianthus annuus]KAJ0749228.1 hypothetical protein HanLR1_Chr05g0167391 [Helianthus annuus]